MLHTHSYNRVKGGAGKSTMRRVLKSLVNAHSENEVDADPIFKIGRIFLHIFFLIWHNFHFKDKMRVEMSLSYF